MSDLNAPDTPQFNTAEYVGAPGEDRCRFCNQLIPQQYYRVGNAMACGSCTQMARHQMPVDSHGTFTRALIFGIGAAIVGFVLYAGISIILSGLIVGYMSFGVGYIVGKGMMMGSKGVGGRRYQIVAVILTYVAVSVAAVPFLIYMEKREKQAHQREVSEEQQQLENESSKNNSDSVDEPKVSLGSKLAYYIEFGLESPFIELQQSPVYGLLGLIILSIGIRIAWRMTAGRQTLEIEGPFETRAVKPA